MNELYDLPPGRAEFDESKHRPGRLCKRGHDWMGTGHSLRRINDGRCIECARQRNSTPKAQVYMQEWRKQNLEDQRRKGKERMAKLRQDPEYAEICRERTRICNANSRATNGRTFRRGLHFPPHLLGHGIRSAELKAFIDAGWDLSQLDPATVAESRNQWRQMQQAIQGLTQSPSVAQLVMDEQKRYWRENPEAKKRHESQRNNREYAWRYKWDPLFRRHECQRNSEKKARNRGNHTVKVSRADLDARFAEFGDRCAFCGSADQLIVEHFIPRSKGGSHAIGNLLPACHTCNTNKYNHDPEKWYRAKPFFTEARWRKILSVLCKGKGSVNQLPLL
jgi:5-methylcytosine-specific restriction endonuclease McrA